MDNNDIKVLEKIGLQEVCKKTHIEVKQLEFMINRQYDKLNKINTIGFVKILSREYKLDLTDWLEGFYDYWADHSEEDAGKTRKFYENHIFFRFCRSQRRKEKESETSI